MSAERPAASRVAETIQAIARSGDPRREYRAWYRATVKTQSADLKTVDVDLDDDRLPAMSKIPIKHGLPGAKVAVAPKSTVMVGFENGDPAMPFAAVWDGGTVTLQLTLEATKIELGRAGLIPGVDGVVTGQAIDTLTGLPQWMLGNASPFVLARKV